MKPKFIALNLLLLAAIGGIAWQARNMVRESNAKRAANLNVITKPAPAPPFTATPKPDAPQAMKYADVATKNLFSKDRNPNVIIDPPKVEKPKEMPPLPVIYGVLGLPSGTRALMAVRAGDSTKTVRAGDQVGEFKVASLDPQNVTFDWEGKQISKKVEDLIDRSSAPTTASGPAPAATAASGPAAPPPPRPAAAPVQAGPGTDVPTAAGMSQKTCVPGDPSPAGTVVDGFRKNVVQTPFGPICSWIKSN